MKSIMIRCDADNGDKIGHGHAMRCFALAQAIKLKDVNPIFLMAETLSSSRVWGNEWCISVGL